MAGDTFIPTSTTSGSMPLSVAFCNNVEMTKNQLRAMGGAQTKDTYRIQSCGLTAKTIQEETNKSQNISAVHPTKN
jgi:hypothetical protein